MIVYHIKKLQKTKSVIANEALYVFDDNSIDDKHDFCPEAEIITPNVISRYGHSAYLDFKERNYLNDFQIDKSSLKRTDKLNAETTQDIAKLPKVNYRKERIVRRKLAKHLYDPSIAQYALGKAMLEVISILPRIRSMFIWNTPNGADLDVVLRYTDIHTTVITENPESYQRPLCYCASWQNNSYASVHEGDIRQNKEYILNHYDCVFLGDLPSKKNTRSVIDDLFNRIYILEPLCNFNQIVFQLFSYNSESIKRLENFCEKKNVKLKTYKLQTAFDLKQTLLVVLDYKQSYVQNDEFKQTYVRTTIERFQFIGVYEKMLRCKDYHTYVNEKQANLEEIVQIVQSLYVRVHTEMSSHAMKRGLFGYLDPLLFKYLIDDDDTANNAQPGSFVTAMFNRLKDIKMLDFANMTYTEYGSGFGSTALYAVNLFTFSTFIEKDLNMQTKLKHNLLQVADKKKFKILPDVFQSQVTSDVAFIDPLWSANVDFSFEDPNFREYFQKIMEKHKYSILRVPHNHLDQYQYDVRQIWSQKYAHWSYLYFENTEYS